MEPYKISAKISGHESGVLSWPYALILLEISGSHYYPQFLIKFIPTF